MLGLKAYAGLYRGVSGLGLSVRGSKRILGIQGGFRDVRGGLTGMIF